VGQKPRSHWYACHERVCSDGTRGVTRHKYTASALCFSELRFRHWSVVISSAQSPSTSLDKRRQLFTLATFITASTLHFYAMATSKTTAERRLRIQGSGTDSKPSVLILDDYMLHVVREGMSFLPQFQENHCSSNRPNTSEQRKGARGPCGSGAVGPGLRRKYRGPPACTEEGQCGPVDARQCQRESTS
jgi:hypothetical protein